ncbi:MAG TPA: hypothetical protein VMV53_10720 [Acidimicrobiales bacterium]|nr:hypothetical protein [Acidimicrobiales bacterium]
MSGRYDALAHVFACCDAIYRTLGEGAPRVTTDAYVVRLHEMSRRFGAIALELRGHLEGEAPAPLAVIERVLAQALEADPSGALALYGAAMVVSPRLLVTVRDARAVDPDDQGFQALLDEVASTTVAEIHLMASLNGSFEAGEDPRWRAAARALVDLADASGNAESFVWSR